MSRYVLLAALTVFSSSCGPARMRVSPEQVIRASGLVRPGDRWVDASTRLYLALGPPTRATTTTYAWAALSGDDCYLIEVRVHRGIVTSVDDPARTHLPARAEPYEHCAQQAKK